MSGDAGTRTKSVIVTAALLSAVALAGRGHPTATKADREERFLIGVHAMRPSTPDSADDELLAFGYTLCPFVAKHLSSEATRRPSPCASHDSGVTGAAVALAQHVPHLSSTGRHAPTRTATAGTTRPTSRT